MIRIQTPSLRNSQQLFPTLLFVILFSSCATLSHIDKAQDEFNKGAEIENAAFFNQSISLTSPPPPADYYYKRAYAEVNQALTNEAKLKKLDIYVNASTVKALCEWKLKKYAEARKTAKVATDYMDARNISADDAPRDFAVLHAMSALIGIEEMNELQTNFFKADSIGSEAGIAQYNKLIHKEGNLAGNIEKDLEDLKSVSKQISETHEVQTYLIMSQLAALKVWDDALESVWKIMDLNDENNAWQAKEEKALVKEIKIYGKALGERIGKDHAIYMHWNRILTFSRD